MYTLANRWLPALVAAVLVMPTAAAHAQRVATASPRANTASCLAKIPASAFTRVVVYAYVDLGDSVSQQFASSADNLLQELVLRAHPLLGATADVLPRGEPTVAWQNVDTPLQLIAYRDGRILPRMDRKSERSAAWVLARALDSMSTVGLLEWSAESKRDSISFNIAFMRPVLDSTGKVSRPEPKRTALPVLSISAPWERQVSSVPGQQPPRYPSDARWEGYNGTVILSFLVDTTGQAVESSIQDVWPKDKPRLTGAQLRMYESFVDESRKGVTRLRFIPASIGGCKVPQLVEMPFLYSLNQ